MSNIKDPGSPLSLCGEEWKCISISTLRDFLLLLIFVVTLALWFLRWWYSSSSLIPSFLILSSQHAHTQLLLSLSLSLSPHPMLTSSLLSRHHSVYSLAPPQVSSMQLAFALLTMSSSLQLFGADSNIRRREEDGTYSNVRFFFSRTISNTALLNKNVGMTRNNFWTFPLTPPPPDPTQPYMKNNHLTQSPRNKKFCDDIKSPI